MAEGSEMQNDRQTNSKKMLRAWKSIIFQMHHKTKQKNNWLIEQEDKRRILSILEFFVKGEEQVTAMSWLLYAFSQNCKQLSKLYSLAWQCNHNSITRKPTIYHQLQPCHSFLASMFEDTES